MHYEEKKEILENIQCCGGSPFSEATLCKFVDESAYTLRRKFVETINDAYIVSRYLNVYGHEISKQRLAAFKELCLLELQHCRQMPDVQSHDCIGKYMHIMEHLHDGSFINQRAKLQELADKLELKIIRTIPTDNKPLMIAFLKVVCFYGNKKLYYTSEDKKLVDRLLCCLE